MTEMRSLAMGQYGHNNQPSHHILFLYALLGDRPATEKYVREVINRGYGEDFYAGNFVHYTINIHSNGLVPLGDEDNGEMGSWFVLSALGLFSTTPGTPDYVMTTPLFKHTIVHRAEEGSNSAEDFHIIAKGADTSAIHTARITLDGDEITAPTLSDYDIRGGRVLQFVLTNEDESAPLLSISDARATANHDGEFEEQLHERNEVIKDLEKQLMELRKEPPASPHVAPPVVETPAHNNLEPQYVKLRRDSAKG